MFRADCRCRPPDRRSRSWQQPAACAPSHSPTSSIPAPPRPRHRRLAVSGTLGVRVGRSAALRAHAESAGVLQGTPGIRIGARQTPPSQRRPLRAVRRSGVRMDRNRGNPRAVAGWLFRPLLLPAGRTTGRGRGSGGGMRTVAPAISAFGPVHARQAPPPGRQRAAQRESRPLSGCQRAFRGCTPGYPWKSV